MMLVPLLVGVWSEQSVGNPDSGKTLVGIVVWTTPELVRVMTGFDQR